PASEHERPPALDAELRIPPLGKPRFNARGEQGARRRARAATVSAAEDLFESATGIAQDMMVGASCPHSIRRLRQSHADKQGKPFWIRSSRRRRAPIHRELTIRTPDGSEPFGSVSARRSSSFASR